eukprot:g8672.t1
MMMVRFNLAALAAFGGCDATASPCLDPSHVSYKCSPIFPGELSLRSCGITDDDVQAGHLHACFEDFGSASFSTLDMSGNHLSSLPPGIFDSLPEITSLTLTDNRLTSLTPGIFDALESLFSLDLTGNRLTMLPPRLFDSPKPRLLKLHLGNNSLTLSPGMFDSLPGLGYLFLSANNLTVLPPRIFDPLVSLGTLDLSSNGLTSLHPEAFDPLESLSVLSPDCYREYGPLTVLLLEPLKKVDRMASEINTTRDLSGNQLASLSAGLFDSFLDLGFLDLSSNKLSSLSSGIFDSARTLRDLYLDGNQLTSLPDGVFDSLQMMETLFIRRNNLTSLSPRVFASLAGLYTLDLRMNQLTTLPEGVFDSLEGLWHVSLEGNKLISLPAGLFDSNRELAFLNLRYNPDLQSSPRMLSTVTNVLVDRSNGPECVSPCLASENTTYRCSPNRGSNYLRLEHCDINDQDLEAGCLRACFEDFGITMIKNLALNHNAISTLPPGIFDSLQGLKKLRLENNKLTALPPGIFDSLPACSTLCLAENALRTLPPGIFDSLPRLARLDLHQNELTELPSGVFDYLSRLKSLRLEMNNLTTLPAGVFSALHRLNHLGMFSNQLTTLPPGVFDSLGGLRVLHALDNRFTALPPGIFDPLKSLTVLNLMANELTTLPAGVFDSLRALTGLSLKRNRLTILPNGIFDSLEALTLLILEENPDLECVPNLPAPVTLLIDDGIDGTCERRLPPIMEFKGQTAIDTILFVTAASFSLVCIRYIAMLWSRRRDFFIVLRSPRLTCVLGLSSTLNYLSAMYVLTVNSTEVSTRRKEIAHLLSFPAMVTAMVALIMIAVRLLVMYHPIERAKWSRFTTELPLAYGLLFLYISMELVVWSAASSLGMASVVAVVKSLRPLAALVTVVAVGVIGRLKRVDDAGSVNHDIRLVGGFLLGIIGLYATFAIAPMSFLAQKYVHIGLQMVSNPFINWVCIIRPVREVVRNIPLRRRSKVEALLITPHRRISGGNVAVAVTTNLEYMLYRDGSSSDTNKLASIMRFPPLRDAFGEFCRRSLCSESFQFLLDVAKFLSDGAVNDAGKTGEEAEGFRGFGSYLAIVSDYIVDGAHAEVNIGYRTKSNIMKYSNFTAYSTLDLDNLLNRFLESPQYKEIVNSEAHS